MKLGTRSAGVLLHPTCLPGPYGIGDIGPTAHRLAEALAKCGQSWWQMLPIVPPGAGNSPYNAFSAFAGNPMLLSLESLEKQGYLKKKDIDPPQFPEEHVDFWAAERFKQPRLVKAFEAFEAAGGPSKREFKAFCKSNEEWLEDYALFEALKGKHPPGDWLQWEPALRRRDPKALEKARNDLTKDILLHKFLQFEFSRQWEELRKHCAKLGVGLIGDIPIFVAHDSADVWSRPEIFWLDKEGRPLKMAGVPPDYFSKTGQLWGNPLYRWDALKKRGYDWWISRFQMAFKRFDAVRLDHFIGFHNYWEIPGGSTTAEKGQWVLGPGADLFEKSKKALGPLPLIAEDLGVVTQGVKDLRDGLGFPGMGVMQMAFGNETEADNYKPKNYPVNCVAYTGTHDHDTALGWFSDKGSASSTRTPEDIHKEHSNLLCYVGTTGKEINWDMIRAVLDSAAHTAIIPIQDIIGLGSHARMNLPGTSEGNWRWRMQEGALTPKIKNRLSEITKTANRWPRKR